MIRTDDSPRSTRVLRSSFPAAPLGGAGAGFGLAVFLFQQLRFEYVPYDSIIGPPAFYNFDPRARIVGYLMMTFGAILGGMIARCMADRAGRPGGMGRGFISAIALIIGTPCAASGLRGLITQETADAFVHETQRTGAWLWAGFLVAAGLALSSVPVFRNGRLPRGAEAGGWFCLIWFHLWLLLEPVLNAPLAIPFSAVFAGLFLFPLGFAPASLASGRSAGPVTRWSSLERAAWIIMAILPTVIIPMRFWWSISPGSIEPGMQRDLWTLTALMTAHFALLAGLVRMREGARRMISPLWLIPFAAMTLYRGCGLASFEYDPYHQGEYTYSWHAMKQGLLPWRDIFYVHGFGFNTLPGMVMDRWLELAPNLDIYFLDCVATAGVGIMAWLYLRLWGRPWWIMSISLAMFGAGASPTKSARYLPVYLMALLFDFSHGQRRRLWLALAGLTAGLGVLYSLDTGVLCVVVGFVWCIGRGWSGPDRDTPVSARLRAALAMSLPFLFGGLPVAIIWTAWLLRHDMLADFIDLHTTYMKMKYHNDSLPLPKLGLTYFLSPLLTIAGALTLFGIWLDRRSKHESPLEAPCGRRGMFRGDGNHRRVSMLAFFVLANFVAFLRGLDRSDEGHLIYGSLMAWPLLGALIARKGWRASPRQAFIASTLLLAVMILLPWMPAVLRGTVTMIIPPHRMLPWYVEGTKEPAAVSAAMLEWASISGDIDEGRREEAVDGGRTPFNEGTRPADWPVTSSGSRAAAVPLLDFSSSPALYRRFNAISPSRFYALYYASNNKWQEEIIRALKDLPECEVLWPAGKSRTTDGIDFRLRNWRVMHEVLKFKGGPPDTNTKIPTYHDILIFKLGSDPGPVMESPPATPTFQSDPWIDLGWIPWMAGRHSEYIDWGDPLVMTTRSQWHPTGEWFSWETEETGQPVQIRLDPSVVEAWIEFEANPGACQFELRAVSSGPPGPKESPAHEMRMDARFFANGGLTGPYRIPIGAMPGWMCNDQVRGRNDTSGLRMSVGKVSGNGSDSEHPQPLRYRISLMRTQSAG